MLLTFLLAPSFFYSAADIDFFFKREFFLFLQIIWREVGVLKHNRIVFKVKNMWFKFQVCAKAIILLKKL
jgi:hypothetical protein